ncbi:MAG: hypothetical protein ACRCXZ_01600 [Patescibacteria group bacterium]
MIKFKQFHGLLITVSALGGLWVLNACGLDINPKSQQSGMISPPTAEPQAQLQEDIASNSSRVQAESKLQSDPNATSGVDFKLTPSQIQDEKPDMEYGNGSGRIYLYYTPKPKEDESDTAEVTTALIKLNPSSSLNNDLDQAIKILLQSVPSITKEEITLSTFKTNIEGGKVSKTLFDASAKAK